MLRLPLNSLITMAAMGLFRLGVHEWDDDMRVMDSSLIINLSCSVGKYYFTAVNHVYIMYLPRFLQCFTLLIWDLLCLPLFYHAFPVLFPQYAFIRVKKLLSPWEVQQQKEYILEYFCNSVCFSVIMHYWNMFTQAEIYTKLVPLLCTPLKFTVL